MLCCVAHGRGFSSVSAGAWMIAAVDVRVKPNVKGGWGRYDISMTVSMSFSHVIPRYSPLLQGELVQEAPNASRLLIERPRGVRVAYDKNMASGAVAQLVEQRAFNPSGVGSTPTRPILKRQPAASSPAGVAVGPRPPWRTRASPSAHSRGLAGGPRTSCPAVVRRPRLTSG